MLTKRDLQKIGTTIDKKMDRRFVEFEKVVDNKITRALMDFFEQVLAPYLDKRFGEVEKRFTEHDERFDKIDRKLEKIDDRFDKDEVTLDNHEKRILKLEKRPTFA